MVAAEYCHSITLPPGSRMLGLRPISKIDSALAARAYPSCALPSIVALEHSIQHVQFTVVKISYHILIALSIGFEKLFLQLRYFAAAPFRSPVRGDFEDATLYAQRSREQYVPAAGTLSLADAEAVEESREHVFGIAGAYEQACFFARAPQRIAQEDEVAGGGERRGRA